MTSRRDPAELSVEQPIVLDLAVNIKTAAVLGLTIPNSVVARADRVIERDLTRLP
jgi:putative ABC transport system substrate-binding protein